MPLAQIRNSAFNTAEQIANALDWALRIGSRADIQGNVTYWSAREASVSEGARVHGKLFRNAPPERPRVWPAAAFAWFVLISINFVSTLILALLSLRFFRVFIAAS